jgi:hypothetical protein
MVVGGNLHAVIPQYGTPAERRALSSLKREMIFHGVTPTFLTTGPAHYNPKSKSVHYDTFSTRTGLHEYGHATSARNTLLGALRRANMRTTYQMIHTPLLRLGLLTQIGPTKDSSTRGAILGGALAIPALAEEATANIQAATRIIRTNGARGIAPAMRYLAAMAPAFSTYVGKGAFLAGTGYGAGLLREKLFSPRKTRR